MTDETSTNTKESGDSSQSDSAKKKSLIIRVIVILGLIYFGVTEFILKEPEQAPPPKAIAKSKNKPKKNNAGKPGEAKTPDAKTDLAKADNKIEEIKAPEATQDANPPVENINIVKKQEEVVAQTPAAELPPIPEKEIDKKIDQLIEKENTPVKTREKKYEPIKEEMADKKKEDVNLVDKIVAEDKYTEPPTLEFSGRGLVYSCKEKFWACTNKTNYVQCNKNMKWNAANGKPTECATVNIYTSNDDCTTVQRYNISTNQPTPFCKQ